MYKINNYIKEPNYADAWDTETISAYINNSENPRETTMIAQIINNTMLSENEAQLPLFLRDWVSKLHNLTKEDMKLFYETCLKGGQAHSTYITEKWTAFRRSPLAWVLELDKECMATLAIFFNKEDKCLPQENS